MMRIFSFPFRLIYVIIRRLGILDVTQLLHLPQSECRSQRCPDDYEIRTLNSIQLGDLIDRKLISKRVGKASDLTDRRRGLVGVFYGEEVIAFLWMAKQNVDSQNNYSRAVHLGTSIDMPDGTGFIYNAWTSPKHRGKRLVAAMMTYAIRNRVVGAWAALTMVDWTNHQSVRAFEYIGMRRLGWIVRFGHGPLQISFVPKTAGRIGLRVADDAPGMKMAC